MLTFRLPRRLLLTQRKGYAFLVGVLAIGAVGAATTISMILVGLAAYQSGEAVWESAQAWEYANTCAERALQYLRDDLSYAGEEEFTFKYGSCEILSIGGSGNENRTLCAEGILGDTARRVEVSVLRLFPSVVITDWKEVFDFTLCR